MLLIYRPSEKAAIGYVYSDSDYIHNPSESDNDSDSQDSEPDLEMDLGKLYLAKWN